MEGFPFQSVPIQHAFLEVNFRSLATERGGLQEFCRWSRQRGLRTATINASGLDDMFMMHIPRIAFFAPDAPDDPIEQQISHLVRGWKAGVDGTEYLPSVETKLTFSHSTKIRLDEWVVACTTMDELVTRCHERFTAKFQEVTP